MPGENGADLPNERREDQGRSARKDRKLRGEHLIGGLLAALLGGGQIKAGLSSSDAAAAATALASDVKGLSSKWDKTDAKLSELQLALTEMRARGDSADERVKQLMSEFAGIRSELRDLRDGAVRSATKQEEVERRVGALEGKK